VAQSTVTPLALNELVNGGQLMPAGDGPYPAWMVPPAADREPNPSHGYVLSFVRLHEHGFNAPASWFMRGCATFTGWSFRTSPQRHLASGFLRCRLCGISRGPNELGPLGLPLPQ
jgi:hypothetical protein